MNFNSLLETTHKIGDNIRSAVSAVTPVPTETRFIEEGTLTPVEFAVTADPTTI